MTWPIQQFWCHETLCTEVHVLSFLAHLSFAPRSISGILSPHRIFKIAHRRLFLFIFSASQLRTEVHIWKFCHHLEFEALRTEVNFCSLIAHLSFAPRFNLCHVWSCYHHIKVETLRTKVHLCSYLDYENHVITISRLKHCAPTFIFVHL